MCSIETTTPTCTNSSCQPCIAVAKVDEEISQVVATLQRLLATRRDLRSKQNNVHDPMHRLPVEVRNHIFELLLPIRDEWGRIETLRPAMPTRLASICRTWYDTASSNPMLWSTMDLEIGRQFGHSQVQFVRNWILRSQSLPLTLRIHTDGGLLKEELDGILDAISQSSTRWLSLSLTMPNFVLRAFHHSNFPYHHLKRLQIFSSEYGNEPVPLLNPKVSPVEIDIPDAIFQCLQISWNHLTTARFSSSNCAHVMQLFQQAPRMTTFWLTMPPDYGVAIGDSSMPPITHQSLEVFRLFGASKAGAMSILGNLTLPSLQELHINQLELLRPALLSALVHRSSCPLTRITFGEFFEYMGSEVFDMQPLPGVTDIVVESISNVVFKKMFLEEYFPDLLHLTLRLHPFLRLWNEGAISAFLDCNRARLDSQQPRNLLLVDTPGAFECESMWNSDFKRQLEAFGVRWRMDEFEFL